MACQFIKLHEKRRDLTKIVIDEIHSKSLKMKYPTNKVNYVEIVEVSDYKVSNKKSSRYNFVITDNFSIYTWCIAVKNKKARTITHFFSKDLTTSKEHLSKSKATSVRNFVLSFFENVESKN